MCSNETRVLYHTGTTLSLFFHQRALFCHVNYYYYFAETAVGLQNRFQILSPTYFLSRFQILSTTYILKTKVTKSRGGAAGFATLDFKFVSDLRPRSAGWPAAAGLASALIMTLFMRTVFPDRTVFFSHNNQPEQYFGLFFSPAEQAHNSSEAFFFTCSVFCAMCQLLQCGRHGYFSKPDLTVHVMCGQNSNNSAVSFFPFCRTFNILTNNWVAVV